MGWLSRLLLLVVLTAGAAGAVASVQEAAGDDKSDGLQTPSICKIGVYDKIFDSFLLPQWRSARQSMNLSVDFEHDQSVTPRHRGFMDSFFLFANGATSFCHSAHNVPITYARILKCGNEAIRINLYALMMRADRQGPLLGAASMFPAPQQLKSQAELDVLRVTYANRSASAFPVFTFVRDPLAHFISGLTECAARSYKRPVQVTPALLARYVRDVANFHKPLKQLEHIFPMAGTFFSFGVGHVGRLEAFDSGWAAVKRLYSIPEAAAFNRSADTKRTAGGKDPNSVRRAFDALLLEATADRGSPAFHTLRAVCALILIDYVCFPSFPLPAPCADLEADRDRGAALVRAASA